MQILKIGRRGSKFIGFPYRVNVFVNASHHLILVNSTVYGSVGKDWFHFTDRPSQAQLCKANSLQPKKNEYTFYGRKGYGGIVFDVTKPDKVQAL